MKLKCLFNGHTPATKERIKEIDTALFNYGHDIWGSSAFSNMDIIEKLIKEYVERIKNELNVEKYLI